LSINLKRAAARMALLPAALALLLASSAPAATYDLVISGGRVMDPASGFDGVRNVGVSRGIIRAISSRPLAGKRRIDAHGLVVAPGFIDLHSHGQNALAYRLQAQDGVTSALEMEEGVTEVPAWYQRRVGRAAINYGATASLTVCRALAFGATRASDHVEQQNDLPKSAFAQTEWQFAEATPAQHAKVLACLQHGLDQGALGIGVHMATTPGVTGPQLIEVFRLAARNRVPVHIHIRPVSMMEPVDAVGEAIADAETTGAAVQVCHLNSIGLSDTGKLVDMVLAAQKRGVRVTGEVYPYTAVSTNIGSAGVTKQNLKRSGSTFHDIEWVATGERLTEETFDKYRAQSPEGRIVAHVMRDADVDAAVVNPGISIASDNVAYVGDLGHPRSAGTFSRVLARYVREKHALSLMDALAKMTSQPAGWLGASVPAMKRRGRIQVSAIADIVVFDPEQITDNATYERPTLPSSGIAWVLVDGRAVVADGVFQPSASPGQSIRR